MAPEGDRHFTSVKIHYRNSYMQSRQPPGALLGWAQVVTAPGIGKVEARPGLEPGT